MQPEEVDANESTLASALRGKDVMNELNDRQIEFLATMHDGSKSIKALMEDMEVSPGELAAWLAEPAFRGRLEEVNQSLEFQREQEVRLGATEATRRGRQGLTAERKFLSARHFQQCKEFVRLARAADKSIPQRYHPSGHPKAINPVHPKFAAKAAEIVRRMAELRESARAIKANREMKQLPAPPRDVPDA
jgi:hypothetical protein